MSTSYMGLPKRNKEKEINCLPMSPHYFNKKRTIVLSFKFLFLNFVSEKSIPLPQVFLSSPSYDSCFCEGFLATEKKEEEANKMIREIIGWNPSELKSEKAFLIFTCFTIGDSSGHRERDQLKVPGKRQKLGTSKFFIYPLLFIYC